VWSSMFGYLDAATGSMIVQLLLGGLAAVVVTAKLWWNRLLRLLRIRRPEEPARAEQPAAGQATAKETGPNTAEG
jgi:hypothetical protein